MSFGLLVVLCVLGRHIVKFYAMFKLKNDSILYSYIRVCSLSSPALTGSITPMVNFKMWSLEVAEKLMEVCMDYNIANHIHY